jgi:hypothetical protein
MTGVGKIAFSKAEGTAILLGFLIASLWLITAQKYLTPFYFGRHLL